MIIPSLLERSNKVARESEGRMIPFGIVMFINFPLFHLLLFFSEGTFYNNLPLRLSASILCIPLILKKYWPNQIKPILPAYWHFTIMYCLPFFFTFMTLKGHMSALWLMNGVSAIFFMLLILDILSFFVLFTWGFFLGILAFYLTGDSFYIDLASVDTLGLLSTYGAAIIIGAIFSYNNFLLEKEKINTMKMLAGSIAHELRTPLSAIMLDADTLAQYIPFYEKAFTKTKELNLPLTMTRANELESLKDIPENLQMLSRNAQTMITMVLANLNETMGDQKVERCSIASCVEEALNTYPLSSQEKELIKWDRTNDFDFIGHKEATKHVIFNLLKNALYAIASAGKGTIHITIKTDETIRGKKVNQLIFKDTGPGISPQSLPHIFDRFYTKTRHGTGIGLAFCQSVIKGFGGEMTCSSQLGEHTTFTISLPILEKN